MLQLFSSHVLNWFCSNSFQEMEPVSPTLESRILLSIFLTNKTQLQKRSLVSLNLGFKRSNEHAFYERAHSSLMSFSLCHWWPVWSRANLLSSLHLSPHLKNGNSISASHKGCLKPKVQGVPYLWTSSIQRAWSSVQFVPKSNKVSLGTQLTRVAL